MKKTVLIFFSFFFFYNLNANNPWYFKSAAGYSKANSNFTGVACDFEYGYRFVKCFSVGVNANASFENYRDGLKPYVETFSSIYLGPKLNFNTKLAGRVALALSCGGGWTYLTNVDEMRQFPVENSPYPHIDYISMAGSYQYWRKTLCYGGGLHYGLKHFSLGISVNQFSSRKEIQYDRTQLLLSFYKDF